MKEETFQIISKVKKSPVKSGLFFERMKEKVLGKKYNLSVVFVGKKTAKDLNKKYRGKDYATDILSFPIDKNNGEIIINPDALKTKAKEFEKTPENYLYFLFIHGLVHLKGFEHGSRMESEEKKYRKIFYI